MLLIVSLKSKRYTFCPCWVVRPVSELEIVKTLFLEWFVAVACQTHVRSLQGQARRQHSARASRHPHLLLQETAHMLFLLPHCTRYTNAIGQQAKLLLMQVRCMQEMRNNISEELERCEEELDREERYGGRRRSSDTADFRDTLAGYKYVAASLLGMHTSLTLYIASLAGWLCVCPACQHQRMSCSNVQTTAVTGFRLAHFVPSNVLL